MHRWIIVAIASVMPLLAMGTSDAKAGGWYDRGYGYQDYGYRDYYPAPVYYRPYRPHRPYYYAYGAYPGYYRPYYRPYPVIGIGWGWGWGGRGWGHRW